LPVNQRATSTALQREEQKGKKAFSSRRRTGERQLGHRCITPLSNIPVEIRIDRFAVQFYGG